MSCICCQRESGAVTEAYEEKGNKDGIGGIDQLPPRSEAMERGLDGPQQQTQEEDELKQQYVQDIKAVQWIRERSMSQHTSGELDEQEKGEQDLPNTAQEYLETSPSVPLPASDSDKEKDRTIQREEQDYVNPTDQSIEILVDDFDGRKYHTSLELKTPTTPKGAQYQSKREINIHRVVTDLDAGSDVNSVTKEQYDVACQLLQKRIMQKKEIMTTQELAFLHEILLGNDQQDIDEDRLSAVESATHKLDTDKLFELDAVVKTTSFSTPERQRQPKSFHRSMSYEKSQPDESSNQISQPSQLSSLFSGESSALKIGLDASLEQRSENPSGPQQKQTRTETIGVAQLTKADPTSADISSTFAPVLVSKTNSVLSAVLSVEETSSDEEDDKGPYPVLASTKSRLLRTSLMEALRGFLPFAICEQNYWLKYSFKRDGASLEILLHKLRACQHTLIIVESHGQLFGSFTSEHWRKHAGWFGNGEAFLFRKSTKLEVYPFTNSDDLVQYCSSKMLCVGGGDFNKEQSPWNGPTGIGFLLDGDLRGGESQSCATFCNPSLCKPSEFEIDDVEVWTLTPCMAVDEAEKLELHKLFVSEHRRN